LYQRKVCKTFIRRFNSDPRLQFPSPQVTERTVDVPGSALYCRLGQTRDALASGQ